jgi:hypothetical protein
VNITFSADGVFDPYPELVGNHLINLQVLDELSGK